ncbi:MAG: leucine-rich repeat domain-containing protein [Candidatus Thorarchaeota archaeon]|jgi:Leucine-rich repeat (LRR) protein
MVEIYVWYVTSTGLEYSLEVKASETCINLDLRDIASVDLLPLIWCTNLQELSIRNNSLVSVDLSPLSKCPELQSIRLGNNKLGEIDLTPLEDCPNLVELSLLGNRLRRVDISPLFHCPNLTELKIDDSTTLIADLTLKSVGSWPEVLVERFHRILWKIPESR